MKSSSYYDSTIPVAETLKDITNKNNHVKIYRVINKLPWNLSKAFNLAIRCAHFDNIYKLDCDVVIKPNMTMLHPIYDHNYYRGHWQDAKNENELQMNGILFCKYHNLIHANLYNENFTTYGYDDTELYNRLSKFITSKSIESKAFQFLEHSDETRLQHSDNTISNDKKDSIQLNRILCDDKKILSWSHRNYICQFDFDKTKKEFHLSKQYNIELEWISYEKKKKKLLMNIMI